MAAKLEFTDRSQATIVDAFALAREHGHIQVHPVHLALALLEDSGGQQGGQSLLKSVLDKAGGDPVLLSRALSKALVKLPSQDPPQEPDVSPALHKIFRAAQDIQKNRNDSFVSQDHLILALLNDSTIGPAFKDSGATEQRLKDSIQKLRAGKRVDSRTAEEGFEALSKYARNLTASAADGKLDPVIGRGDELRRSIRILSRKTKSNVVLVGPPGVGKTAISEALAMRIVERDVPAAMLNSQLWALDMGLLLAGASHKGEFEERVKSVIDEVEKSEVPIILFIDEVHLLLAGKDAGGVDAGNLLKPALARGTLHCIGATTEQEYQKYIERDAALARRFGVVRVAEPSIPETIGILRGIRERYELFHGVVIQDAAIVSAVQLAKRFLSSRMLPDSAIDVLDEAAAATKLERDSIPEEVDKLERKRLQLEVEVAALERELKGDKRFAAASAAAGSTALTKERLEEARKEVASINDTLKPLQAAHEAGKARSDEIQAVRQRIDTLKTKMERAERERDLATAADLRHGALPELQAKLDDMERAKASDESGSIKDVVTSDRVAEVVARWSGVPLQQLQSTEKERLLKLEKTLARDIVGQPEACRKVAEAIRLSRSGLVGNQRPIASFLFVGPSGTGKTQLCKVLARTLFDNEDAITRIDGSEYSEKHNVSRLIGAPPGYVGYDQGGVLTEAVKRKSHSIILIDEIEKAHPQFQTILLQVLDAGRLTSGQGDVVDFRNTVIIMTSNLGSPAINATPDGPLSEAVKNGVLDAVRAHFLPEFLGRVDSTVIFNRLGSEQIREIVTLRLREIQHLMADNGKLLTIKVSDAAIDWLGSMGVSPQYGARPLATVIREKLLVPLSRMILAGQIHDSVPGEVAKVELDIERNLIYIVPNHEATMETDGMDIDDDGDVEIEEMD